MKKLILILVLFLTVSTVYSQSSSVTFARYDSLSSAIDTLSRIDTAHTYNHMYNLCKQHYQFWAICDSAFYISTSPLFPKGKTILVKANEPFLEFRLTIDVDNYYFKTVSGNKALFRRGLGGY